MVSPRNDDLAVSLIVWVASIVRAKRRCPVGNARRADESRSDKRRARATGRRLGKSRSTSGGPILAPPRRAVPRSPPPWVGPRDSRAGHRTARRGSVAEARVCEARGAPCRSSSGDGFVRTSGSTTGWSRSRRCAFHHPLPAFPSRGFIARGVRADRGPARRGGARDDPPCILSRRIATIARPRRLSERRDASSHPSSPSVSSPPRRRRRSRADSFSGSSWRDATCSRTSPSSSTRTPPTRASTTSRGSRYETPPSRRSDASHRPARAPIEPSLPSPPLVVARLVFPGQRPARSSRSRLSRDETTPTDVPPPLPPFPTRTSPR